MGLQRSAAGVLGTVRDFSCERGTRSRATIARLDRGRCLALHPKGGDSDPENVFRAKWKTVSFARVQPDYAPGREHCIDNRRNYCRARSDKNDRARRTGPGLLRAQCDAEVEGQRISMIAEGNTQRLGSDTAPKLRVVFVGDADHGNSTPIGRI